MADNSLHLDHRIKQTDASKLQDEYSKLVEGLQQAEEAREEETFMVNPGTSRGLFPGNYIANVTFAYSATR